MLKTVSSIVNAIGALNYKGTWNATTNTPTLASGVGSKGNYYVVSVGGTTSIDGVALWGVGDMIAFNGSAWQRIDGGVDGNFVEISASGDIKLTTAGKGIYGTVALILGVGTSEYGRFDSSGRLLLNDVASNGDGTLETVARNNSSNALVARSTSSSDVGNALVLLSKFDNDSTTSQVFQRYTINNNGTANGQINANGAGQVAFGSWSDVRLKENIVDLDPQLEKICSLRPVEFDYKVGGHQIGFIAQEVQQVYPDLVGQDAEGMLTLTGLSKNEARLISAIKEQQKLIEQLAERIASLEPK
jgi:hypothetical protein